MACLSVLRVGGRPSCGSSMKGGHNLQTLARYVPWLGGLTPREVWRCEVTWGSSMLKANALRQAVEAERRVYAKGVATPLPL